MTRSQQAARRDRQWRLIVAQGLEEWLKRLRSEGSDDECDHIRQSCADVGCDRPIVNAIKLLRARKARR